MTQMTIPKKSVLPPPLLSPTVISTLWMVFVPVVLTIMMFLVMVRNVLKLDLPLIIVLVIRISNVLNVTLNTSLIRIWCLLFLNQVLLLWNNFLEKFTLKEMITLFITLINVKRQLLIIVQNSKPLTNVLNVMEIISWPLTKFARPSHLKKLKTVKFMNLWLFVNLVIIISIWVLIEPLAEQLTALLKIVLFTEVTPQLYSVPNVKIISIWMLVLQLHAKLRVHSITVRPGLWHQILVLSVILDLFPMLLWIIVLPKLIIVWLIMMLLLLMQQPPPVLNVTWITIFKIMYVLKEPSPNVLNTQWTKTPVQDVMADSFNLFVKNNN